jgi:hypothetical protein
MLAHPSYGVAQHIRPLRHLARDATVAIEARVELRRVEGRQLVGTSQGFAVFEVRDHRLHNFSPTPQQETEGAAMYPATALVATLTAARLRAAENARRAAAIDSPPSGPSSRSGPVRAALARLTIHENSRAGGASEHVRA